MNQYRHAVVGWIQARAPFSLIEDRINEMDELSESVTVPMKHVGPVDGIEHDGTERFEAAVQLPHAGLTGYTVRVLPYNPLLASPVELGKVVLAG